MIRSRSFLFVILAVFFEILATVAPAYAGVDARSAILMNASSGEILYVQNADEKIAPASLTKIMTMYVALDCVNGGKVKLSDRVKISRLAAKQGGSRMHVKAGEIVSLDQLLKGVAISSGNDASVAVAEYIGGSVQGFVKLMNAKAAELGMKNTSYRNPNGLPASGQVTTASDMLTLTKYYLKNHPGALSYHSTRQLVHNGTLTTNKNPLLRTCPGTDGLKTGWIRASGFNLIATGTRNDNRLIGIVMGAPTPQAMGGETLRLMEAGYQVALSHDRTSSDDIARNIPR